MGCHDFLQGIFPIQGWNPGLLKCRQILYHLSYQGSPSSHIIFFFKEFRKKVPFNLNTFLLYFSKLMKLSVPSSSSSSGREFKALLLEAFVSYRSELKISPNKSTFRNAIAQNTTYRKWWGILQGVVRLKLRMHADVRYLYLSWLSEVNLEMGHFWTE